MTLEEVRNKVAESPNREWLMNNINFGFSNPNIGLQGTYKGFPAAYEFVSSQIEGWIELGDDLPQLFTNNKTNLINLKQQLLNHLNFSFATKDINQLNQQWHNILANYNGQISTNPIYLYNSPETLFLNDIYRKHRQYFDGAYNLIQNQYNVQNFSDRNRFIGAILAEEFIRDKENVTISCNSVMNDVHKSQKLEIDKYISGMESYLSELKLNTSKNFSLLVEEVKTANMNTEQEYSSWFKGISEELGKFVAEEKTNIYDLKQTFSELTRLKEPAEYWKARAEKLKKEGGIARNILIGLILFGTGCLYFLLWKTPEGMLKSFFDEDKTAALRWSIVFVTFISLLFLGIRYASKIMFSSFHLSRDAEERYQLTHVYLALIKEANIDEKERHLIMQSLFSRADTGLLKEESSPTMPNGIDKIIRPN